jgi:hypothetical protein
MTQTNAPELLPIGYRINSNEELKKMAPAAFSRTVSPILTDRYSYFSTEDFLQAFEKLGWKPYSVKQNGASPYSRHIIRLINPDFGFLPVKGDKIRPQIIIDNSHDGFTKAQIHLGLLRLVSTSGLVIAIPGLSTNVKWLHVGVDQKVMIEMIADIVEQYRIVGAHVSNMQQVSLTEDQKQEFAIKAIAYRDPRKYIDADGTINEAAIHSSLDIHDIYEPIRPQDESDDLWTLFNVVQERTIKGMFEMTSPKGRKSSPRVITNGKRNLEYNKKLWILAESFMPATEIA